MELETPRLKPDPRPSTQLRPAPVPPRRPAPVPDRLQPSQRDLAFKNFGVMDTGRQDKKSVATSLVINGCALALVVVLSLTTKKMIEVSKVTTLTAPIPVKPPEPPKPPVKLPKPPVVKVTPPKPIVDPPKVTVPEPPKVQPPVVMKTPPTPIPTPAPPKAVTPPPAPKPVAIQIAQAASIANNNPHPSPIRVGSMTNPINNTAGPAVSPVNLGRSGAPGMNAANTGMGPASKINIGGSGSPNGTNMNGHSNSAVVIKGVGNGVTGGTGPLNGRPAGAVQIASVNPPPVQIRPSTQAAALPVQTGPKVISKPKPVYTAEAVSQHIEGNVQVKIHVAASGAVTVLGVTRGLGHGLDQSALAAAQAIRFTPAKDASGNPVDWDGVVSIVFQLAG